MRAYMVDYFVERYPDLAKEKLGTDTLDTQLQYSIRFLLLRRGRHDPGIADEGQHHSGADGGTDDVQFHAGITA